MNHTLDLFSSLWCIESQAASVLATEASKVDLTDQLALQARSQRAQRTTQRVDQDNIALISLKGPLSKHSNSLGLSTSTVLARRDIEQATRDPDISGIFLSVESPGGTVPGTSELAESVAKAAGKKPVLAYCEDLAASAAFWVISGATTISANQMARVGSIGTYATVTDSSGAASAAGIKVNVINAGEYKGVGTPGTAVSVQHLAYLKSLVDDANSHFLKAVAKGRKMSLSYVKNIADGRVHPATQAKNLRLIDQIESFEDAFVRLRTLTKGTS